MLSPFLLTFFLCFLFLASSARFDSVCSGFAWAVGCSGRLSSGADCVGYCKPCNVFHVVEALSDHLGDGCKVYCILYFGRFVTYSMVSTLHCC